MPVLYSSYTELSCPSGIVRCNVKELVELVDWCQSWYAETNGSLDKNRAISMGNTICCTLWLFVYVCMYAYMCVCVCACVRACVCVCMYVRMYVYPMNENGHLKSFTQINYSNRAVNNYCCCRYYTQTAPSLLHMCVCIHVCVCDNSYMCLHYRWHITQRQANIDHH